MKAALPGKNSRRLLAAVEPIIYRFNEEDVAMNTRLVTIIVLAGFAALFMFQNVAIVEIQFLFWSIQMSRSLLILGLLAIGMIRGWILHGHLKHRQSQSSHGEE